MQYDIAVFASRSETLNFANLLKYNGIMTGIINTPKEAGRACGISVKFPPQNLAEARRLLSLKRYYSFVGFFRISSMGARMICEKL